MDLSKPFTLGQWTVKPSLNLIERDKDVQTLTPKVMGLLILLLEHEGQPVSQQTIFDTLWPDQIVSDASIYQAIAQLRKAFKDDKTFIERISGQGYRINCPPTLLPSESQKASLKLPVGIFTVLLIIGLLWFFSFYKPAENRVSHYQSLTLAPIEFAFKEHEQQAANISDQLLTSLVPMPSLTVINHQDPEQEISSDLLLSGRLSRDDGRDKLTLSIKDMDTEEVVWARLFTTSSDNKKLQHAKIIHAVSAFFTLSNKMDFSPDRNEDYLLARFLWQKRTPESLNAARGIFEKMQQQNTLSALGAVGLCETYYFQYLYDNLAFKLVNDACSPLLEQALLQAPELGQAMAAKANLMTRQGNYLQAEALFKQAIQKAPNYALAHFWYGYLLREQGQYEHSFDKIAYAYRLDPMSPSINLGLAYAHLNLHQMTQARQYYQRAITLEPDNLHGPVVELDFYPLTLERAKAVTTWAQDNPKALLIQPNYQLTHVMVNLALGQYGLARQLFNSIPSQQLNPAYKLYVEATLHTVEDNPTQALQSLRLRYESLGEKDIYLMPYATQLAASGLQHEAKALLLKHHSARLTDVTEITEKNHFLLVFWFSLQGRDIFQQQADLTAKLDTYFSQRDGQLAAEWWMLRGDKQKVAAYLAQADQRKLNDFNQDHLLLWRDARLADFVQNQE